jgi:Fe-S-cluster containining protein
VSGFVCTGCGACCTNLGRARAVLVLPSDLRRLAAYSGLDESTVTRRFLDRHAGMSAALGKAIRVLRHRRGRCVFLTADNRCSVHAAKPRQCREGPDRLLTSVFADYPCMADGPIPDAAAADRAFFIALLTEE